MTRTEADTVTPSPAPGWAPRPVIDTLRNVFVARALHVVTELGVAEALAAGPRSCLDLARELGADATRLHQLVRTVASLGLFARIPDSGTGAERHWSLTDAGETLLAGHPAGTRDLVLTMQGQMFQDCVAVLGERVRSGRTGPEIAHDTTFFDYLGVHPDEAASFDRMMTAIHGGEFEAVARAIDLRGTTSLVDIGGGVGKLTHVLLHHNPDLHGIVLDLPVVAGRAQARAEEVGLGARCAAIGASFFSELPGPCRDADVYLLSYVLHDWDDDECVRILERVAAAMRVESRLLVVEMVLPDDDSPHPGKTLDMVMATMTSGVERSGDEYEVLLARAGLRLDDVIGTDTAVSVVVAALPAPADRAPRRGHLTSGR